MEDYHGKWDKSRGKQGKLREEVTSAKEEVRPEYEEYLLLLQQRNRLLKKLKEKNEQQIELEKKEQGFSLYVNGANVGLGQAYSRAKSRSSSRHTKTAGDAYRERKKNLQHELETLEREAESRDVRVKTAPDPTPSTRKGWKYDSIQIKTEGGKSVRLKAPGRITGKYSEDFESVAVDSSDSASDQDVADNDLSDQDELELNNNDDDDDDDNDDEVDELTLSFNDVETLRKSLEADESIKESIEAAKKRIEEETKEENTNNNNIDNDNEDEIEEELEEANSSLNLHDAAVLERLPQLTSTPDKRQVEVESSTNTGCSVSESVGFGKTSLVDSGHGKNNSVKNRDFSVTSDGHEKRPHQRSKKLRNESENPVEDLVLSFSSSTVKRKERNLSATRRKKNADHYDSIEHFSPKDDRSYAKQQKRSEKHESQNQEVTLTSASEKKSRPLSATRRMEPKDKLDDNAVEIFKAMAEENQTIESKASGSQTAPVRSKNLSSTPLHEVKRPSSLASFPLKTDDTIALVTEKVRKMDARQQQSLIELLSKLECKAPLKVPSPSPSRPSPMKATVPFSPVTKSSSIESQSQDLSVMDSLEDAKNNKVENEEGLDVYFEIISNWGNSSYVGLTEIQFFDLEGNMIPYDEHNVSLSGHVGDGGVLGNLTNGKTKTIKGRYMWSCGLESKHPVELVFHLPSGDTTSLESHGLSKISVWNYNRGIKELNFGAKDVRIFVGGELVWEGVIDKGCGNQVFDYGKVINLTHTKEQSAGNKEQAQDPEPIIRSETVVLRRSVDGQKDENKERGAAVKCDDNSEHDVSRSKTVFLKSSTEEDPQGKERDIKADSVGQYKNERPVKGGKHSKEHDKIPKPPESPRMYPKSPRPHRQEKSAEESKAGQQQQGQDKSKEKNLRSLLAADLASSNKNLEEESLVTRSSSTPNLSSSEALETSDVTSDSVRGNAVAGSVLPNKPPWLGSSKKKDKSGSSSRSSSRSKSRPIWLENDSGVDPGRSNSLTDVRQASDDLFKNEKPHSRPSSGRRSSTPGASDKSESLPSEFLDKDECLPTCLDGKAGQSVSMPLSERCTFGPPENSYPQPVCVLKG
ncbi:protein KIAA0556-like [Stylophora pistillata]|uniref:protein KIAA0556-like n=1 Tax=Stylophora pistillata TaxID=50429 RepID=UPI000C051430|nr:protein KIAA0556-like [Stylophora pistillata]